MPPLKSQDEIDAYYLSDTSRGRAAGVLWGALIERRIDSLFETALRPDANVKNELFQPTGALGNFAVKVRLSYLLGWIENDIYRDILYVIKIRNRFAHYIETKDFSDQQISDWVKNMKVYGLLPKTLESAKEKAAQHPHTINKVTLDILTDALEDPQMGYRFCIDMMLHHLDKCRANMDRNLSNLQGNWMTADGPPTSPAKP